MPKRSADVPSCAELRLIKRRKPRPLTERFWPNVRVASGDDCWLWTAGVSSNGYGQIRGEPRGNALRGKKLKAHRVAYELTFGPIPNGKHVCHRCDNPRCVNQSHLFLGTHQDNMADKIGKRRHAFGNRQPSRKLTSAAVRSIAWLLRHDVSTLQNLADDFGVSASNIALIKKRAIWRSVLDA